MEPQQDDSQIEQTLGNLLRAGVLLAAAVVAAGGALYLIRHGTAAPEYKMFRGEPAELRTLSGIFHDALAGSGRGMIQLGLVLLIATPIARVAFSVYAFAREGDRKYVVITLIVLALLAFSLFGSTG